MLKTKHTFLHCLRKTLPLSLPILFSPPVYAAEKLCAIYPHLKDSYWLSVNYGMVSEAEKQKVNLRVLEAGGYPNTAKQQQQLMLCSKWGADAILLGTVDPMAFNENLQQWTGSIPIFATVNQLVLNETQSKNLKGTVGVDWYWMGHQAGHYLAQKHPAGSGTKNVVLLLGPKSSGGTKPVDKGFRDAIKGSDIHIMESFWADNDKELQRNLVQQAIDTPDVDYLVGSAVAMEAAISELRSANKTGQIGLISTYLSHGIYRGLLRNKIEFAPSDQMVLQGRLSVDQAVNYLRHKPYQIHSSPTIEPLTPNTLNFSTIEDSLSPSEYRPIFDVKAVESQ
ncbi:TPA: TMAO reductase system periplasmic protein TorT [Vibrio vulnificus]